MRLKTNIHNLESPLETLQKIRGVEYNWLEDYAWGKKDKLEIGFIAQEILHYYPELVVGSEQNTYMVRYREVIAICIEALKEQDSQINRLEERAKKLMERAKEKGYLV